MQKLYSIDTWLVLVQRNKISGQILTRLRSRVAILTQEGIFRAAIGIRGWTGSNHFGKTSYHTGLGRSVGFLSRPGRNDTGASVSAKLWSVVVVSG
jgi:hypothetical protein